MDIFPEGDWAEMQGQNGWDRLTTTNKHVQDTITMFVKQPGHLFTDELHIDFILRGPFFREGGHKPNAEGIKIFSQV